MTSRDHLSTPLWSPRWDGWTVSMGWGPGSGAGGWATSWHLLRAVTHGGAAADPQPLLPVFLQQSQRGRSSDPFPRWRRLQGGRQPGLLPAASGACCCLSCPAPPWHLTFTWLPEAPAAHSWPSNSGSPKGSVSRCLWKGSQHTQEQRGGSGGTGFLSMPASAGCQVLGC